MFRLLGMGGVRHSKRQLVKLRLLFLSSFVFYIALPSIYISLLSFTNLACLYHKLIKTMGDESFIGFNTDLVRT